MSNTSETISRPPQHFCTFYRSVKSTFLRVTSPLLQSTRTKKTGRVLEVPLQLRRLKPCATPSIFPSCPAYLSRNTPAAREGPEEKRTRLEAETLQGALTLSTEAYEDEQRKNSVSSFDELVASLKEFQVADFWIKLATDKQVLFWNFGPRDAPVVRYSVTVSADLSLKAYFGDLQLDKSDCLQDRFGRYRQLCGAQYDISIRQIYESEHKIRLQNVLELPEFDDISLCARTDVVNAAVKQFDVEVTAVYVKKKKEHMLPAITYVAGYCAHAALKKLMCPFCKENLVVDNRSLEIEAEELIAGVTRGELKFPQAVVVNAVLTMNIVLKKLSSERYALKFYSLFHYQKFNAEDEETRNRITKPDRVGEATFQGDLTSLTSRETAEALKQSRWCWL
ncbi:hypothetical protein HPB47_016505 [Ixodes persulcatus]|uniref:Uncharacterized protein n=1 Tax=Ixodes persulcatus TaxID=34615 RepID=A0AC60R112_IXOPE|nr:hypothetical protein HPB47_016505 [Ixodes persulcatus]